MRNKPYYLGTACPIMRYRIYKNMAAVPASYLQALYRLTLPKGLMRGRAERARATGRAGKVVVAFKGSHPVGWNLVDYKRVVNQYVHPNYRGMGIGATLLITTTNVAGIKLNQKAVYSHMLDARKVVKRARSIK